MRTSGSPRAARAQVSRSVRTCLGVLVTTGAVLAGLLPASAAVDSVTVRVVPPVVALGEPTGVAVQVDPVRSGRVVELQQYVEEVWRPVATGTTDSRGRALLAAPSDEPGTATYRVVSGPGLASEAVSGRTSIRVTSERTCSPSHAVVDPRPTGELVCLAERIDRWQAAGLMGVGQQLNVSNADFLDPLDELSDPVRVVGFDLEELARGETYQFERPPLRELLRLADEGAVLTASWHATNPETGRPSSTGGRLDLAVLLDDQSPVARRFWADWDDKLRLLARFQDGDGLGGELRTAVALRPLHEANGGFFWWGKPDPRVHRKVWAELQRRAWDRGVHNILWTYAFNLDTAGVRDPATLLPARVDLAGLDSYDPEKGRRNAADRFDLAGYTKVARLVPRMALTEAGPHGSAHGTWDPAVITRAVSRAEIDPAWAMLWFDDGSGRDGSTGRKQISSLRGGRAWLRGCPHGYCT